MMPQVFSQPKFAASTTNGSGRFELQRDCCFSHKHDHTGFPKTGKTRPVKAMAGVEPALILAIKKRDCCFGHRHDQFYTFASTSSATSP